MTLRHSNTLFAQFYDRLQTRATAGPRQRSLARLATQPAGRVLLNGVGTGLDLPYLPLHHHYLGLDLTPAMLARCPAPRGLRWQAVQGDACHLPFADASFDAVVLHLILAVVPQPEACMAESTRILRPGGQMLVFDKFLRPGQPARLRRALSPLAGQLATRLDVEFEPLLAATPGLRLLEDQPALAGGWFRLLHLQRAQG